MITAVDSAKTTDSQPEYKQLLAEPTQPGNTSAAAGTSEGQKQASAYRESEMTKRLLLASACCACSFNGNTTNRLSKQVPGAKHQTRASRKLPSHEGAPQTQPSTRAATGRRTSSDSEKHYLQQSEVTAGRRRSQHS